MKDDNELFNKLNLLLYKKFILKIQINNKKNNKTHLLNILKKKIARIKTLISLKNKVNIKK